MVLQIFLTVKKFLIKVFIALLFTSTGLKNIFRKRYSTTFLHKGKHCGPKPSYETEIKIQSMDLQNLMKKYEV